MRDQILQKLPRAFLGFLLAAGITFCFLGALNLDAPKAACFLTIGLILLLLEIMSLNRKTALGGAALFLVILVGWLSSGSGFSAVSDVLRALTLQLSGIPGALPLAAREASLLFAGVFAVFGFFSSRESTGFPGAMLIVMGSLLMLWLADRPDLMIYLLPAGIAALCLWMMDRHRGTSFVRILPWAAALVLLAFGLTPPKGMVIPELKEKTDAFRQMVMDRLFFTEPRDVFSLSSEGFYPQGISQLGGPVTPSDHPVMQVSTPRTAYLRGVLMNEYDGRAWRNTLGGRRYLWDASGMAAQRSVLFDQRLPSEGLQSSLTAPAEVSVRMLGDGASTLFVPQRVRTLQAGGELVPYYTNSSELFVTRNLQGGDTWSVSAPLFRAGDPGLGTLVDAAADGEDPQWETLLETYTRLPAHLEEPVWQMAADITENLYSAYEKAFAIQNYLSRNYRYTLDVAVQPVDLDFVTNFLFNTMEGYCTYFASAMTVLCRMAGLPARYVEGYLAEPDANGEALVRGLDAHAWTEVYFRGFGWLTFDATPRRTGDREGDGHSADPEPSGPPEETPSPTQEALPEETPAPEGETETPEPQPDTPDSDPDGGNEPPAEEDTGKNVSSFQFPWTFLWILLLLLAAGGTVFRWIRTSPVRQEKRAASEAERFDLWLEDLLQRLSAMGLDRTTGETLMGFTRRLDTTEALPVSLAQLGECASLLHYGRVHAMETDTALAREASKDLKKAMPLKARMKYALRRLNPLPSGRKRFIQL